MGKRITAIAAACVVVLMLTGCGENQSTNIHDVADAREQCHELEGVFAVAKGIGTDVYYWECDLSDPEVPR